MRSRLKCVLCTRNLFLLMHATIVLTEWRFRDFKEHISVAIPFTVEYENETTWNANNLTWYTSKDCQVANERKFQTSVACKTPGAKSFGVTSLPGYIMEHKRVYVIPNAFCYQWKVNILQLNSSSFNLTFQVSPFTLDSNETENDLSEIYYKLHETPKVVVDYQALVTDDLEFKISYEKLSKFWWSEVTFRGNYNILLHVSSSENVAYAGCLVKSRVQMISLESIETTSLNQHLCSAYFKNYGVFQNPSKSSIVVSTSEGDTFAIKNDMVEKVSCKKPKLSQPTGFAITTKGFAYIRNGDVVLVNEHDQENVISSGDVNRYDSIVTCSRIPKGLPVSCDHLVYFNSNNKNGVSRLYKEAELHPTQLEIPHCNAGQCSIEDLVVDLVHGYVKCLFTRENSQYVLNYDLHQNKWLNEIPLQSTNGTYKRLLAFDTILVSENGVFTNEGIEIYRFSQGELLHQIHETLSEVIIQLKCNHLIVIHHGGLTAFKVKIGQAQPFVRNGLLYQIRINESSGVASIEELNLVHELEAQSLLSYQILSFTTNITRKTYYLDKNDLITIEASLVGLAGENAVVNVVYDKNIGLTIDQTNATSLNEQLFQHTYVFTIGFSNNADVISRTSSIAFVPSEFNGIPSKQARPQTMFIKTGCPPQRKMKFIAEKPLCQRKDRRKLIAEHQNMFGELNDHDFTCLDVYTESNFQVTFAFEDNGDELLGDVQSQLISGDPQAFLIDVSKAGKLSLTTYTPVDILLKVQVTSQQSTCAFSSHLLVHVEDIYKINTTIITILSICSGMLLLACLLSVSFVYFKRKKDKEHLEEAELLKRQRKLRYLANLKHYQDQMQVNAPNGPRSSLVRRKSSTNKSPRYSINTNSVMPIVFEED